MEPYYEYNFKEYDYPIKVWQGQTFGFPPHWHEEMEIILVVEGQADVYIRNDLYSLYEGDIMIIGRKDIHRYVESTHFHHILMKFHMNLLESLHYETQDYQELMLLFSHSIVIDRQYNQEFRRNIGRIIRVLLMEYEQKKKGYKYAILSEMYNLMTALLREDRLQRSMVQVHKKYQAHPVIEYVMHHVEKHYHEVLSLEEIIQVAHLSKNYFTRLFKTYTGMTFKQFVTMIRLQKSRECLAETDDTIVDIAYLSGFNSVKTFNRVFHKHMGCSPSTYRKCISEKNSGINEKDEL